MNTIEKKITEKMKRTSKELVDLFVKCMLRGSSMHDTDITKNLMNNT